MQRIVCLGGASIDRKYHALEPLRVGTSNPTRASRAFGGVARNVAENLARLGVEALLFSSLGCDQDGRALLDDARRAGVRTHLTITAGDRRTAEYAAVLDPSGELFAGVSDMEAVERIGVADVEARWSEIAAAGWLFADCNLPRGVLNWCVERARADGVAFAVDAVSESKVRRLPDDLRGVHLLVMNESEAAIFGGETIAQRARAVLERGATMALIAQGERGAYAAQAGVGGVQIPAVAAKRVDATGAGDALCAAVIARLMAGDDLVAAARAGTLAAALTIESSQSVRPDLSAELLEAQRGRLEASCIRQ